MQALTDDWQTTELGFQIAEVSRPLLSVGTICDKGNIVIFTDQGGVIYNLGTERTVKRNGGLYEMGFWLPTEMVNGPELATGFTRQGR